MATSRTRTRRRTRIGPQSNGMLMTGAEFDTIRSVDDRYGYELVRGVLVVTRFPSESERDPNQYLGHLLLSYVESQDPPADLDTLSEVYIYFPDNRRRADRAIWIGLGRVPDPEKDVPTIAVEFVSRSTRDRVRDYEEKRREYLAAGVKEYWVIDRFARTMTVFRQPPAEPAEQVIATDGTYRTPLLPGFDLPPARLFARADRWVRHRAKKGDKKGEAGPTGR